MMRFFRKVANVVSMGMLERMSRREQELKQARHNFAEREFRRRARHDN